MRIAQFAPLTEAIHPKFYGGTERAASRLTGKAVSIRRAVGRFTSIAAKIDDADRALFGAEIGPMLRSRHVELIGQIGENEKVGFLSGAVALLMPVDWLEPIGLVMIEAMACGTPVIAFNRGPVPEIVEDGSTGFVAEHQTGAIGAAGKLGRLSRATIRRRFVEGDAAGRMARDCLAVHGEVAGFDTPRLRLVAEGVG